MPRFFHVVCIKIDNTRQTSWKRFQSPTLVRFNGWWQDPAQALKTRLTARVNVTSCRSPVVSCLIICCIVNIHNIQYYHNIFILVMAPHVTIHGLYWALLLLLCAFVHLAGFHHDWTTGIHRDSVEIASEWASVIILARCARIGRQTQYDGVGLIPCKVATPLDCFHYKATD